MDCEQLNKDIANLRASRDAFQKIYDYANTNLRGGAELRQSQKNLLESGDALLLKYFEDFEKQNPDKWFRKFGEFEEPSEEEKEYILRNYECDEDGNNDRYVDYYCGNRNKLGEVIELAHDNWDGINEYSIQVGCPDEDNDDMDWIQVVFVGDKYLAIGNGLHDSIIINHIGQWGDKEEERFSIKGKKYTRRPRTLIRLNEKKALVGCYGGGVVLIGERKDGSWGVLEDKRWVPDPSDPLSTHPDILKLESGKIGLYDWHSDKVCVFEMEKSLKKLKRALWFDDDNKEES